MKYQYKIAVEVRSMVDETTIVKLGFVKEFVNSANWTLVGERGWIFDTAIEIDEKTTNAIWTIEKVAM